MTDDDCAWPNHAQNVPSIDTPEADERVVGIDASQNSLVASHSDHIQDSLTEDSRPGSKKMRLRTHTARSLICSVNILVYLVYLLFEHVTWQLNARLVMHGVVAKFIASLDDVAQQILVATDLVANDEESSGCAIFF